MSKINPIALMSVCYMLLILLSIPLVVAGQGTRIVSIKRASLTIQEAINEANIGDTIHVPAGIYFEHIVINKTVALVGEDSNTTVIDGSNSGTLIQVTSDNVSITGFRLQNSGYGWTMQGVYVYRAVNCTIKGNNFYNVCHNVRLNCTCNSQVLENTINGPSSGVAMYGIRVENSINCTVANNRVTVIIGAIHLENATECTVKRNLLIGNDQGIRLYSPCVRNLISENTVCNNNYDGMIALMPENSTFMGNLIYHNNFINDTNPFIIQSSGTVWDDGLEGNYWSRYQGVDLDKDGIGDAPYVLGTDRDNSPLMGPFSYFEVRANLSVNVVSDSIIDAFTYFESNRTIRILVSNATDGQTQGFCRITVPHALMNETYRVTIDDAEPLFVNYTLHDDGSKRWMYFSYNLSHHEVTIVPEFPSITLPMILTVAAVVYSFAALTCFRKKHQMQQTAERSHRTFLQ